jgi:hypothetical protein
MSSKNIISKGVYRFSQPDGFIHIKNYIFMNVDGNICIAARFENNTDIAFDSFCFSVIQLNADGREIGRTRVEYKDISFAPGSTYSPSEAVIVDRKCVDFKVQFYYATSGCYRYVVRRRRVSVYYDRKLAGISSATQEKKHTLRADYEIERKYVKTGLMRFCAIMALLIIIASAAALLLDIYIPDEKPQTRVYAAEYITEADVGEKYMRPEVEYAEA